MNRMLRCLVALAAAAALCASDWARDFASPPDDYGLGVYWWWFGPAQTREEVSRELRVMRDAGITSVLIFPIYPLSADDPAKGVRNARYLSPEFLDVLGFAAAEAKSLGITSDVLIGTGWPYGGPTVDPKHAAAKLRAEFSRPEADGYAAIPKPGRGDYLEAAFLLRGNPAAVELAGSRNITRAASDGRVRAAPGEVVLAVFRSPTGMQVKRPALGGEGLVLDHLGREAVEGYLAGVGDKLAAAGGGNIRAVHSDSLEVYGQNWTAGFPDEFLRRRGYDLTPWLPALFAQAGPLTPHVRHDFWRTVTELFIDHYAKPLQDWAHRRGVGVQSESYGTPPVDLTGYKYVDFPMGEQRSWKTFSASRWASSAAHQYGRRTTSAETWTWLRQPRYVSSLQDLKVGADMYLACGVNKFVGHGYAYSPPAAGVPGWGYYASVMLNDNNTFWPHFRGLSDYVRRASYAVSLGKPKAAVGLYLPEDDVMAGHTAEGDLNLRTEVARLLTYNSPGGPWALAADYKAEAPVITAILLSGFTFDGFDRSILQTGLDTSRGRLAVGDAAYRIAVLPNLRGIALPVLEKLVEFCRSGGVVIATRRLPETAYGLKDRERNEARVAALAAELFGSGPGGKTRRKSYGRGQAIFVPDEGVELRKALASLGPEIEFDKPDLEVAFLHRGDDSRDVYFLANVGATAKTLKATFRDGAGAPEFWDPMTGTVCTAPFFSRQARGTRLPIHLEPYGSVVVAFAGRHAEPLARATNLPVASLRAGEGGGWTARLTESGSYWLETPSGTERHKADVPAAPIALDGTWTLRAPGKEAIQLNLLHSWTAIPSMKYFSGTAEYASSVQLPRLSGGGCWLDLGEVREVADVRVNGRAAGVRWKTPYQFDITELVQPGANDIRVAVTNLPVNRILGEPDPDYSALMPLRFLPPMEKEMLSGPVPSGLLGPARIVPYARVKLGGRAARQSP